MADRLVTAGTRRKMQRRSYLLLILMIASACGGAATPTTPSTPGISSTAPTSPIPPPSPTPVLWDLEAQGVPRFVAHDYIELTNITRISRFRSGEGHDYSDDVEDCRSMKHYFVPRLASIDASTIPVSAPVTGTVERIRQEWAGVQVEIQAADYPAFRVILFHVNATIPIQEGTRLQAGQRIGTHIGNQTSSDVAIAVDSTLGRRYVSWFEAITDELMAGYQARGIASRAAAIISRAERDASPLTCNGETFSSPGTLPTWVNLR
jgi:hypothetical protein